MNKKSVTFYFVRHGETFLNKYNRMQGWLNAPLTEAGIQDVRRSGRGLKDIRFDAVYTSDLGRTIDTAEIILEENLQADHLDIKPMFEFREVHFGYFEGSKASEVWPEITDSARLHHGLPEGSEVEIKDFMDTVKKLDPYGDAENYLEFWLRVESGLLTLLNKHAGTNQTILIVSHGLTIRNLLHGLVADFSEITALDNASVSIVKYENGQFQLQAYNQTSHFKDLPMPAGDPS